MATHVEPFGQEKKKGGMFEDSIWVEKEIVRKGERREIILYTAERRMRISHIYAPPKRSHPKNSGNRCFSAEGGGIGSRWAGGAGGAEGAGGSGAHRAVRELSLQGCEGLFLGSGNAVTSR